MYERVTSDFTKWKQLAFLDIERDLQDAVLKNIIAIGDNQLEIDASHSLASRFEEVSLKTIKFREFPRPNELMKQLKLLRKQLRQICCSMKNLTIRLEKKGDE
jgi:hypothetical protein